MEESKYLKLARQARAENNSEDAKNYYAKVREEDPENGEAKYFHAYYSLYSGTNKELCSRFINLCKSLPSSISLIKESPLGKDEQLKSIKEIVDSFVPETWAENKYMNSKNAGNSNFRVFDYNEIKACCVAGMKALKDLGDKINELYSPDPLAKNLAVSAWKEYVALSQKWYAYAVKGDAEVYAEKIKKYDPSYQMPKKAGCISFSNKR